MKWGVGLTKYVNCGCHNSTGCPGARILSQDSTDEILILEEIVVVGTPRNNHTVANSFVPVDVFSTAELQQMGTSDIDDVLRKMFEKIFLY